MTPDSERPPLPDVITSESELRALYPPVSKLAALKVRDRLDEGARGFVARSPLVFVASSNADGEPDVSPRGDAPGFVHVLDERTLVLPDRIGNNRLDTFVNVIANPRIAMIFVVPGVIETLRVEGRASISTHPPWLELTAARGADGSAPKLPRSVCVVQVEELFFHCGKALLRSKLWEHTAPTAESGIDPRGGVPSLGTLLFGACSGAGVTPAEADALVAESYTKRLY